MQVLANIGVLPLDTRAHHHRYCTLGFTFLGRQRRRSSRFPPANVVVVPWEVRLPPANVGIVPADERLPRANAGVVFSDSASGWRLCSLLLNALTAPQIKRTSGGGRLTRCSFATAGPAAEILSARYDSSGE